MRASYVDTTGREESARGEGEGWGRGTHTPAARSGTNSMRGAGIFPARWPIARAEGTHLQLHAEVPARDHNSVRGLDNGRRVVQPLLVLNLKRSTSRG
eukprot:1186314-Prorocentrum_minimum.AAC.1